MKNPIKTLARFILRRELTAARVSLHDSQNRNAELVGTLTTVRQQVNGLHRDNENMRRTAEATYRKMDRLRDEVTKQTTLHNAAANELRAIKDVLHTQTVEATPALAETMEKSMRQRAFEREMALGEQQRLLTMPAAMTAPYGGRMPGAGSA